MQLYKVRMFVCLDFVTMSYQVQYKVAGFVVQTGAVLPVSLSLFKLLPTDLKQTSRSAFTGFGSPYPLQHRLSVC